MASAANHPSGELVRLLVMGPSGTGKTGALLSLLLAGYKVNVIDMDNGLDWLVNKLKKDHPDLLPKLDYQTFRDKIKLTSSGPILDGVPKAYTNAVAALGKWDDGSIPSEWGPDRILVLDSLTFFGNSAYNWRDVLNPPKQGSQRDNRQIYGLAQDSVAEILDAITSPEFRTNVIVFTHVRWSYITDDKGNRTVVKGGPSSIGDALTDKIGTYFNTVGLCEQSMGKRTITFQPTGLIDLKSAAVNLPAGKLPLETGLATFFKAARGG